MITHETNEPTTTIEPGHELTDADVKDMECPDCMSHGTFHVQPHEVVISVGNDTNDPAIVTVHAIVCGVCGYGTVDGVNATRIDEVRARMERGDTRGMQAVGVTYRV